MVGLAWGASGEPLYVDIGCPGLSPAKGAANEGWKRLGFFRWAMKVNPRPVLVGAALAVFGSLATGYSPSLQETGMVVSAVMLACALPLLSRG